MRRIRLLCAVLVAFLTVAVLAFCLPAEVKAETYDIYTYTVENGEATVTGCDKNVKGHILVPDHLGGYPVTTIGKNAFDGCSKLVRVTFYKGITTIEEGAFGNCPELTEVTIPEGLTTIGANAFANCVKLEKLHIPNTIECIDSTAFENCSSLVYNEYGNCRYLGNVEDRYIVLMKAIANTITTCEIHESTKVIFTKAFFGCNGLTNVVIPSGVKTIGENAFFGCTNLRKITMGGSLTAIGEKAFSQCLGLTAVTISDGVTTLGREAFSNCRKMTDIVLPKSLTAIGEGAFNGCTNLKNVYYKGAEADWPLIAGYEQIQATILYNASGCIHKWDEGTVTKEANCIETGIKTYTCSECQEKRTEELPMLTTHTYQNDCDPACDICLAVREITHSYKDTWSADENGHWYECAVCSEKKEAAVPHTPGAEPTEKDPQTCLDCGYIVKPALGHTHNFTLEWKTDREGHWHGCDGCEEKGEYQAHDFENACDLDCSVCGYTRVTQHTFKTEWSANGEKHWHECTGCGAKKDESAHTPGPDATEEAPQTCLACGYELVPAIGAPEPTEPQPEKDNSRGLLVTIIVVVTIVIATTLGIVEVSFLRKKRK